MAAKIRVDVLLVQRGLAETRSQAQKLVMAGQVLAAGQLVHKASQQFEQESELELKQPPAFVSRGGQKLAAAFEIFPIDVSNKTCADVGSSTGGFTDLLLQQGATRVYAIDVGRGQLHWKLRQDERVVVMEQTNARYLSGLPESIEFASIDVSFISLGLIFPAVSGWLTPDADVIALVKPQFEAGKQEVARGKGVIKEAGVHEQVLLDVLQVAQKEGFSPLGLLPSPIRGPKGNVEFLLWCRMDSDTSEDFASLVGQALEAVPR